MELLGTPSSVWVPTTTTTHLRLLSPSTSFPPSSFAHRLAAQRLPLTCRCRAASLDTVSPVERDLTDSTVLRNIGEGLGHSLLAYKSTLQGIGKLQVNEARLAEDLNQTWEVLAEPIQTVMRRYAVLEPYEKLKELTRGRAVNEESMRDFINGLELPEEAKAELLKLTPHTYIGATAELAQNIDDAVNSIYSVK